MLMGSALRMMKMTFTNKINTAFKASQTDLEYFKSKGFEVIECVGGQHMIQKEGVHTIVETSSGYFVSPHKVYTKNPTCAIRLTALTELEVWEGN